MMNLLDLKITHYITRFSFILPIFITIYVTYSGKTIYAQGLRKAVDSALSERHVS